MASMFRWLTHKSLELGGVVWEVAVVDVRLGCHDPEENIGNQDSNLIGTWNKPLIEKHGHHFFVRTDSDVGIESARVHAVGRGASTGGARSK
jgi:hypothetical protein